MTQEQPKIYVWVSAHGVGNRDGIIKTPKHSVEGSGVFCSLRGMGSAPKFPLLMPHCSQKILEVHPRKIVCVPAFVYL